MQQNQNQNQGMSGDRGRIDDTRKDQDRMRSEGGGSAGVGGKSQQAARATGTASAAGGTAAGRDSQSRGGVGKVQPQSGQSGQIVGQQNAQAVQPYIQDVKFPAGKDELLRGARDANAPAEIVDMIVLLDDDTDFDSYEAVVVAISQSTT